MAKDSTKVGGGSTKPDKVEGAPEAPKKEKKGRPAHPAVGNEDTKVYPFTETPKDFDFKAMKGLKKKDFATDEAFFLYKAAEAEYKIGMWNARAEEAKTMGSSKERSKAKRLVRMQGKVEELTKALEAQGIDVAALLAESETDDSEG
jgi:hypothetical protein